MHTYGTVIVNESQAPNPLHQSNSSAREKRKVIIKKRTGVLPQRSLRLTIRRHELSLALTDNKI